MKTCTKCGQELPLDAFLDSSNGRGLFGKRSQCRECQAKYKQQLRINAKSNGIKICTVCREEKPLTEFYRGTNKEGRMRLCKDCQRKKMNNYSRNHTKEHQQKINTKAKEKYHADVNYRQKVLESSRKWRKTNRNKCNARSREWMANNPGKSSEYHARYRTQKAENGGSFTAKEFITLCEEHSNHCLACGKEKTLTADHIIPVAVGGSSDISNIQPLCQSCNSKKWTQIIDYRL